jgi:O-antigen/teichoic acid export membrane protein
MKNRIVNLFFTKDALWTNIIKIFSSSVLTSLITIGLSPLVGRIYTTGAFGLYAIIFATASILSELVTLKYERAIILPEKNEDAISVFWLSIILALLFSSCLYIPIYFFEERILIFHNVEKSLLIYLLPIISFVLASNVSVLNLIIKLKYYNLTTSNRIYVSVLLNGMIILLGYLKFEELGLIISYTLSNLFSSILLIIGIYKKHDLFTVKYDEIKYWAKRYLNFPKFYIPSVAVESSAFNIPNFVFMRIIGASFLGNYNMSNRIVNTPLSLIGNAIRTVFNQAIAEAYATKKTHIKIFKENFYRLFFIAIIPVATIFIWGPQLFSFIFGDNWYDAGMIARYLAPVFLFRFVTSPLSAVLTIYEKLNIDLYIQLFTIITLSLSFYLLWKAECNTYPAFLIAYNIIYCIKYIIEFYISHKLIANFEKGILPNKII